MTSVTVTWPSIVRPPTASAFENVTQSPERAPWFASVTVTNLGNSAFKGTSTVQFFYVDAEGVETAASSVISRRVDLKPGKTQKFDRVAMLARPTVVGEWTLVARVGGAAGDVNTDNNAVTVRTFTV